MTQPNTVEAARNVGAGYKVDVNRGQRSVVYPPRTLPVANKPLFTLVHSQPKKSPRFVSGGFCLFSVNYHFWRPYQSFTSFAA